MTRSCPVWCVSVCPSRTVTPLVSISKCLLVWKCMKILLKPPFATESSSPFTNSSSTKEKCNSKPHHKLEDCYNNGDEVEPIMKFYFTGNTAELINKSSLAQRNWRLLTPAGMMKKFKAESTTDIKAQRNSLILSF